MGGDIPSGRNTINYHYAIRGWDATMTMILASGENVVHTICLQERNERTY